jgi:V/A-type H+-transporting ATPase subunit E
MTESLQTLLLRLQQDGVDKGQQQADELLRSAKTEAERLVADAKKEAARITAEAKADADRLAVRGKASLQQAARDVVLSVGHSIEQVVQRLAAERASAALDGPAVLSLLQRLMDAFVQHGRVNGAIDIVVGPEQKKAMTDASLAGLRQKLEHGLTLHVQPGLGHGFQVRMGKGGVTHDFTDKAAAAAIAELVTPEIAAIVLEVALGANAGRS